MTDRAHDARPRTGRLASASSLSFQPSVLGCGLSSRNRTDLLSYGTKGSTESQADSRQHGTLEEVRVGQSHSDLFSIKENSHTCT